VTRKRKNTALNNVEYNVSFSRQTVAFGIKIEKKSERGINNKCARDWGADQAPVVVSVFSFFFDYFPLVATIFDRLA